MRLKGFQFIEKKKNIYNSNKNNLISKDIIIKENDFIFQKKVKTIFSYEHEILHRRSISFQSDRVDN